MPRYFHETLTASEMDRRGALLRTALDEVLAAAAWSKDQLRDQQLTRLQSLVRSAYDELSFYRNKYQAVNFHPDQLQSLADLQRVPIVTKDELRRADLFRLAPSAESIGVRLLASSGSTGSALRIFRDETSLWRITAFNTMLYYDWCHEHPLADVLYCVDMATDSIDFALADMLRTLAPEERLLPVTAAPSELVAALDDFQPTYFSSYPSTLRSMAMELDRRGRVCQRLKLAHVTSEMLDAHTRRLAARVFPNARVIETYTSTEAGIMGYQCPQSNRWHLVEPQVIPEIVDDHGQPTDELGRLVVTDLTNRATPIIRYAGLGDLCRWDHRSCPCGTTNRSLAQLAGRVADLIVRPDGQTVSPYVVANALEELAGVYQYQITQRTVTEFTVVIVRQPSYAASDDALRSAVANCLREALQFDVQCSVQLVEVIAPRVGAHKIPLVVSHVPRPV